MSKINILIVEPDLTLGKTYKDFFDQKDFEVVVCVDGQGAIDTIDKKQPDLIILEIQLAAHNGYEFLYELRSYAEWFAIPVIINSFVPLSRTNLNTNSLNNLGIVSYNYKPNTSLEKLYNDSLNNIPIQRI